MENEIKFNVNLYEKSPKTVETIGYCTKCIVERLRLYEFMIQKDGIPPLNEFQKQLKTNPLIKLLNKNTESEEIRKIDNIGHWMLKVAYSATPNRSFFIKNELDWFKIRYLNMSKEDQNNFLKENFPDLKVTEDGLFKISWTQVTSLVKLRRHPMKKGVIFVPFEDMHFYILEQLEDNLKESLIEMGKTNFSSWPDQIQTLLSTIKLVKPRYDIELSSPLTLSMLHIESEKFPLCMKFLLEKMDEKHLKYDARIQLGRFLKGVGLPLDEALEMWRTKFCQKNRMTEDFFKKEYEYFFRHLYGTVGSKIQYKAQNCDQIIEKPVGPGLIHGCPFKHWGNPELRGRLRIEGVGEERIDKIIELKSGEKFKEACTCYFQAKYNCEISIIQGPVVYYESCCRAEDVVDIEDLFG